MNGAAWRGRIGGGPLPPNPPLSHVVTHVNLVLAPSASPSAVLLALSTWPDLVGKSSRSLIAVYCEYLKKKKEKSPSLISPLVRGVRLAAT